MSIIVLPSFVTICLDFRTLGISCVLICCVEFVAVVEAAPAKPPPEPKYTEPWFDDPIEVSWVCLHFRVTDGSVSISSVLYLFHELMEYSPDFVNCE
jgi:hypothetical protein